MLEVDILVYFKRCGSACLVVHHIAARRSNISSHCVCYDFDNKRFSCFLLAEDFSLKKKKYFIRLFISCSTLGLPLNRHGAEVNASK